MAGLVDFEFVSGLSGDPAVLCSVKNTQTRFFFDLGSLANLAKRDLVRTTHAFVSHTHIDHFIGFDQFLRVHIPLRKRLFVAGPPNFIDQVSAKLRGYTWNLLEPEQIRVVVHELHPRGVVHKTELSNDHKFIPQCVEIDDKAAGKLIEFDWGGSVTGCLLDHGTPSAAYRFETMANPEVDAQAIRALGLTPGAWIKELQFAMRENLLTDSLEIDGTPWLKSELAAKVLKPRQPWSLGYITDIAFTDENLAILKTSFQKVDTLICEASFRDADSSRAAMKKHLTTRQAAEIAKLLGARELKIFHISNIYGPELAPSCQEAARFFAQ